MAEFAVHFDDVSHIYPDGTVALSHADIAVAGGESVGIIGHNGSGKSTLFMNIVGILGPRPDVSVNGLPVTKRNLREIRRMVGYVFHDPRDQLFMSRVVEDVSFGPLNMGAPRKEALHKALHALEMVGLEGFENRISYHLSGGEMRRAAIATVLAMSPDILVMDEPTAGLDPRSKRELADILNGFDCTKLISSHNFEFVRKCTQRIILLDHGKVVADGPTAEILDDAKLLVRHGL